VVPEAVAVAEVAITAAAVAAELEDILVLAEMAALVILA
jgi:hypothetical protein